MSRQRAQALIEFAFVFPVFILMVLGFLDLGRAVWHYNTAALVARDAARQLELTGTVSLNRCEAMFVLENCTTVAPLTPEPSIVVVDVANCTSPSPGVTVTYTFEPAIPFFINNIPLEATYAIPDPSLVPGACS